MPESVLMAQLHLNKACWELWLSDDQPHSDYNGQWQRALCILAVLQSSQPNPQRNEKKNRKMYAIKQIKICAEYRDMLPRPRLDLSGTPGLRPIGLSPGSWQTSLGLGSMSRYSAQILICITMSHVTLRMYCLMDSLIKLRKRGKSLLHCDGIYMLWAGNSISVFLAVFQIYVPPVGWIHKNANTLMCICWLSEHPVTYSIRTLRIFS